MIETSESSSPSTRPPCRFCGEVHPSTFSHCPKTGQSLSAGRALVGKVVAGRYRVLGLIGEGGMGAVYVAEHLLLGRKVALKRLHPEHAGNEKALARFQREARAAAATGHEHIVEVLDLGFSEDGSPFLVMEYVRGHSLATVLNAEDRLAPARAARIVGQVLAALHAVHQCGIVHRDLKPDNILLTRRQGDPDFVKVVDFGISKVKSEEGATTQLDLTRTGAMLGTPFYMSPEQARGAKNLDHRIDVYGAGVMLYEALTGRLPFDGDNYHQLLQAILSGKHPPLHDVRPELPKSLADVVEKAIAPKPEDRFETARAMLLALVPFGADTAETGAEDTGAVSTPTAKGPARTTPPLTPPESRTSGYQQRRPAAYTPTTRTPTRRTPTTPTPTTRTPTTRTPTTRTPTTRTPTTRTPEPHAAGLQTPRDRRSSAGARTPEPWLIEDVPQSQSEERARRRSGGGFHFIDFAAEPKRFTAQSKDWDEHESLGRSRELVRIEPSARDREWQPERTPNPAIARAASGAASEVKGSLLIATVAAMRAEPELWTRIAGRLAPALLSQLNGVLLPVQWFPLADYVDLLRSAERAGDSSEGVTVVRIGEATATAELTRTHRRFVESATPTSALQRLPMLFEGYYSHGWITVDEQAVGGFRVQVSGLSPDTLVHALFMSGFYKRLLEMTGGREVRAAVISSHERGDQATVTALRWR